MISQLVSLSLLNPDESPEAADDETSLSSMKKMKMTILIL